MFSSRLHWDLRPNRIAAALTARTGPVLDLTESNPTRAGLEYDPTILQSFTDPRSLVYEPAPNGLAETRSAVAAAYSSRGVEVRPDRILLTASTSESYSWLFKLLCDPGDDVLVPRPSYPLFDFLAALECVRVVQYPLAYHGRWIMDFDEMERAVTPRTRAVVLVNPNNPTGSFLKRDERDQLAAFCSSRGLAIISDEVFADYPLRPDPNRVTTLAGYDDVLAFSLGGLSKQAGMPQMKLGWMVAGGPDALRHDALERLELIADTYLSVSTPVQHAAAQLIAAGDQVGRTILSRVRANYDFVRGLVCGACELLDAEGGWYVTLRVPRTRTEEEWTLELLEHENVLVQPGFFYDFENEAYLVLSLLTPPGVFQEGARRVVNRAKL
ncbi:MAG TPA: pyridoxal phosphate-dependent aminotransferase [Bryobacteraceae bacterium]|nr:pyridoxal phosphate-dependent aminotransferase [Bryobacteraceae bacterium]